MLLNNLDMRRHSVLLRSKTFSIFPTVFHKVGIAETGLIFRPSLASISKATVGSERSWTNAEEEEKVGGKSYLVVWVETSLDFPAEGHNGD